MFPQITSILLIQYSKGDLGRLPEILPLLPLIRIDLRYVSEIGKYFK